MSLQCQNVIHYTHVPVSKQASVRGPSPRTPSEIQAQEIKFYKWSMQEAASKVQLARLSLMKSAHAVLMNPFNFKRGRISPELFPPPYSDVEFTLHSSESCTSSS